MKISNGDILVKVKEDNFLVDEIVDMAITDKEIMSYIGDIRRIYRA